jgi:short-subunit dehydrogenase
MSQAIVVGASSGFGLAIARRLRVEGLVVTGLSRSPPPEGAVDAFLSCDVLARGAVAARVEAACLARGAPELVVYSAGLAVMGRTLDVPEDAARRAFEVNFWGLDATVRAVLPRMQNGAILHLSSLVALRAVPFEAYYAASKAAAARYFECLAHEARASNVAMQYLCVGFVDTGFFQRGGWHGMSPPARAGSNVTPDDVAEAALKLWRSGAPRAILGWKERAIALADRVVPGAYDRLLRRRLGGD